MRPPLRWVLVEGDKGHDIPEDALQTGTEAGGNKLFSARAWWKGGLHLGKVRLGCAGTHDCIAYSDPNAGWAASSGWGRLHILWEHGARPPNF